MNSEIQRKRTRILQLMIADPQSWPKRPFLPLKKTDGTLGFIVNGNLYDVVIGNMYMATLASNRKHYQSVDEIIADGWYVD